MMLSYANSHFLTVYFICPVLKEKDDAIVKIKGGELAIIKSALLLKQFAAATGAK